MTNTILQVPMDKALKDRATLAAQRQGFSSLQEVMRVMATKLADEQVEFKLEEKTERISPKAEKRYAKMIADYKKHPEKWTEIKESGDFKKFMNLA